MNLGAFSTVRDRLERPAGCSQGRGPRVAGVCAVLTTEVGADSGPSAFGVWTFTVAGAVGRSVARVGFSCCPASHRVTVGFASPAMWATRRLWRRWWPSSSAAGGSA